MIVKLTKIVIVGVLILLPFFLLHLSSPQCPGSAIVFHHELNLLLAVIAASALGGVIYRFMLKRAAGSIYPVSGILVGTSFTLIFYALFYKVFLYLLCGFPGSGWIFVTAAAAGTGFFSNRLIKGTAKIMDVLLKTNKKDDK